MRRLFYFSFSNDFIENFRTCAGKPEKVRTSSFLWSDYGFMESASRARRSYFIKIFRSCLCSVLLEEQKNRSPIYRDELREANEHNSKKIKEGALLRHPLCNKKIF